MDDLVVIILTIIIVVVGVLGQLKKKKAGQIDPNQQNKPRNIWDLLEVGDEYPEQQFEQNAPEGLAIEPEIYTENTHYRFSPESEGGKVITKKSNQKKVEENFSVKTKEKFSLRKAVIYKAILENKYI